MVRSGCTVFAIVFGDFVPIEASPIVRVQTVAPHWGAGFQGIRFVKMQNNNHHEQNTHGPESFDDKPTCPVDLPASGTKHVAQPRLSVMVPFSES